MRIGFTTICVPTELHDALERSKLHPRQPFHEVIEQALRQARVAGRRPGSR